MKNRGFSLVEVTVVVLISSILFVAIAPVVQAGFDAFYTQRDITDADWQGRLALERMTRDLRAIPASQNITTAASNQLVFIDASGATNTYQLTGTTLTLNGNPLADGISSLTFNYYDSTGAAAATISSIRYITIQLTVSQNNVSYTLFTVVHPRNFSP